MPNIGNLFEIKNKPYNLKPGKTSFILSATGYKLVYFPLISGLAQPNRYRKRKAPSVKKYTYYFIIMYLTNMS